MVTFLPTSPRRPTFGEQVAGGMQRGADIGAQLGMNKYQTELAQKAKSKAIAERLAMLESPENQEFFKGIDPRLAKLSKLAAAGIIEPGVATSMAELIRQSQSDIDFNKALGLAPEGMEGAQGSEIMPGESPLGSPETLPSPTKTTPKVQPSKKPGKDYEGQIAKLQNALRFAATPEKRAQVESSIKELQRQQDLEIKKQHHEEQTLVNKQNKSFKRNEKYLNKVDETARSLPKMRLALSQMRGAVNNKDFNSYRNIAADILGLDFVKTSSAQVVNSAMKEFLMASLSELTGRPNQFIEQQLTKAAVNPQYSDQANELILDGFDLLYNLANEEVRLKDNLESFYVESEGEIPRGFQKIIRDEIDKISEPLFERYESKLKDLFSKEKKPEIEGRKSLKEIFG